MRVASEKGGTKIRAVQRVVNHPADLYRLTLAMT